MSSHQPAVDKLEVKINGESVDPETSGLNFDQGPLIPAGTVVDKPITVKSEYVGTTFTTFTGSLDDLFKQLKK